MIEQQPDPAGHVYEDGFKNPPTPYIDVDGVQMVDLNKIAEESRLGLRRSVMTVGEALAAPGGHHNAHMVNPELHPVEPGQEVDVRALQDAFRAARAANEDDGQTAEL